MNNYALGREILKEGRKANGESTFGSSRKGFCPGCRNSKTWFHRTAWPNYGKLKGKKNCYHCHLKKGKPTTLLFGRSQTKKISSSR